MKHRNAISDHSERHFGKHQGRKGFGRDHGRHEVGRFFDSGDLRYVVLHLIADRPRHGYEIIKMIETLMSGAHSPSPGVIYPTLTLLEEIGLAAVTAEGSRKLYAITQEGKKELKAKHALLEGVLQRMKDAGTKHAQERPPAIMRAMENLKLVLRMRSGQLSPQQVEAVTDIIDGASKAIERL